MSELKKHIDDTLSNKYIKVKTLSDTAINKVELYTHTELGKNLVTIQSNYRNDDIFRKLVNVDSKGYLPEIYIVSSEEDYLIVLEEYVEGDTLAELLTQQEQLSFNQIKNILCDLCNALEILHKNNIVHRDIKPENIIIRNNKACLIDLSIAKIISDNHKTDTINLGTVGYAAPEQFGFSQSQPATDIYAFGVLANEILLGVHPSIEIPKGKIGRIIKKCTDIQISKRYQSINELKKQLDKI